MERVVPWKVVVQIVEPHYPKTKTGRPPLGIQTMLRIDYLEQWFALSDPAMEESLHDMPVFREFIKLDGAVARLPDETTILRFRRLLEKHDLATDMLRVVNGLLQANGLLMQKGTAVDATLIASPSSTNNATGERDPEMHQTKKGNQWYFGMKAHIGVDAHSGLVHSVADTPAKVNDVTQAGGLLHGLEEAAFGDARCQGVHKRPEAAGPTCRVAMRSGLRRKLNTFIEPAYIVEQVEKLKASVRDKVEHPFRVLKRQFGFTKVGYKGVKKNTAQIVTLFALGKLWMARRQLMGAGG